jgi:carotenoid cleavage dioxygenase-like enzyme
VHGEIPKCVDGTFYRAMPDAQFAPKFHDDVFINGDGQVDGISHVDPSNLKRFVFAIDMSTSSRNSSEHRNSFARELQGELFLANTVIGILMKNKPSG